jgi:DNA polymerase-3 subunit chi
METRVDFYVLAEGARLTRERLICRLAGKAYANGKRVYIHTDTNEEAMRLDELLWTFEDIGFLPHERAEDGPDPDTPILVGCGTEPPETATVLITTAHPVPPFIALYERVLEVVDQDPEHLKRSRGRYRDYQTRGLNPQKHDISGGDISGGDVTGMSDRRP